MADKSELRITGPVLVSCAALVVIVAGMRAAQPIVVPFVVATFLAMICLPPLKWLQDKGLPTWLALLTIIAIILLIGVLFVGIVGTSANQLRHELPAYQEQLASRQEQLLEWLKEMNIDLSAQLLQESFDSDKAIELFGKMLASLGSVLSDGLVILLMLIFMMFEAAGFPAKLRAIGGGQSYVGDRLDAIQTSVRQYVSLKTKFSLLTGVLVAGWLWALGVDFPLLWGLLAFLFNFIPNIGSVIAAVPAIVLAFLQLGVSSAIYSAAGYIAINVVVGTVIEPRVMGRGLGLSALVVFISLIFWGWVLGPIGMLLSVPLTMVVKIVLDHSEDLRWVAILLSSDAPQPTGKQEK